MSTVPTQIRIDKELKKESVELFSQLGLDMSGAVTIFLKQCVMRGGLPFEVRTPRYSAELLEAAEEARRISKDPHVKSYKSLSEAMEDEA